MKNTNKIKLPDVKCRKLIAKERVILLAYAIGEYSKAGKRCPDEWIKEIGELNKTFAK